MDAFACPSNQMKAVHVARLRDVALPVPAAAVHFNARCLFVLRYRFSSGSLGGYTA
jgi:hypothetical protein